MSFMVEVVIDLTVITDKFLKCRNRLETLHRPFSSSNSLDISLSPRSAIVAVAKGKISSVSDIEMHSNPTRKLVVVEHDNHLLSIYAAQSEIVVKIGQPILAGDLIGYSLEEEIGSLHFELRHCYKKINSIFFFQN